MKTKFYMWLYEVYAILLAFFMFLSIMAIIISIAYPIIAWILSWSWTAQLFVGGFFVLFLCIILTCLNPPSPFTK